MSNTDILWVSCWLWLLKSEEKMEKPKIDKLSESRKVLNFDDVQGSNNNKSRSTKKAQEVTPDVSTGAIQKKKNAYKTIKPSNSLKHCEGRAVIFISPQKL